MDFPISRASLRSVRLGIDNNRLSALLCAVLDAQGGSVTLTKAQSEKVWEGARLHYETFPDGSMTLTLEPHH